MMKQIAQAKFWYFFRSFLKPIQYNEIYLCLQELREIWVYIGFASINIMYVIYVDSSFLVTIKHILKYLVWKSIKITKQNKITNFWILQMQFSEDVISIVILMAAPFIPKFISLKFTSVNDNKSYFPFALFSQV